MKNFIKLVNANYKFFWLDPAFNINCEHSSDFCEIVDWPVEKLVLECYSELSYDNFEHCEEKGKFGLELGYFNADGFCIKSYENIWFETIKDRELYIRQIRLYFDANKIPEYIKDEKIFKNLQNYSEDVIFNIRKTDGGEVKVFRKEILARFNDCIASYYEGKLIFCPVKENTLLNLIDLDSYFIRSEDICKYDLQKTIDYVKAYELIGSKFNIEAFYANIVSIKLDYDYSILVDIEDMEGNLSDISWDKIKHLNFVLEDN